VFHGVALPNLEADGGFTTDSIAGGGGHADGNNGTDDEEYFRVKNNAG
jgi:hypothetical protein